MWLLAIQAYKTETEFLKLLLSKQVSWDASPRHIVLFYYVQKSKVRTPLVAQWLRIHLPMQGTRVRALVWEDPTCHRTTKPVRHNYWACALEPASHNYRACVPQLLKPVRLEPVLRSKRSHRSEKPVHRSPCSLQLEKTCAQQQRPKAAKNK